MIPTVKAPGSKTPNSFTLHASQGQTRTAALSLKLACRELFREDTGEWPVLLLDDVLSELDAQRQAFVLERITGGQVFNPLPSRRPFRVAVESWER